MDAFRLRNLRTLVDTGFVDVKPLTVLLGTNSSGKSTFLRSFPLVRQSVEERTRGPILWYGRFVDFGSFVDAKSRFNSERFIHVGNRFKFDRNRGVTGVPRLQRVMNVREDLDIINDIGIAATPGSESSYVAHWRCDVANSLIEISCGSDGRVEKFSVNGSSFSSLASGLRIEQGFGLLPHIRDATPAEVVPVFTSPARARNSVLYQNLYRILSEHVHHRAGTQRIHRLISNLWLGPDQSVLSTLQSIGSGGDHFRQKCRTWSIASPEFIAIRNAYIALVAEDLLSAIDEYLVATFRSVSYIAPVRATAERYYRMQDLSVDAVDPQGRNLAVFLRTLNEVEKRDFASWTSSLFGFSVGVRSSGGHTSLTVKQTGSDSDDNLADIGFGFSQVLPVITQLWLLTQGRKRRSPVRGSPLLFCVEQPELHLHPRFQANVARAFASAVVAARHFGLDVRIILETHSETIVNQFGHDVAAGRIAPEDIGISVFEKASPSSPTHLRSSSYDSEGVLENWPIGFFDPETSGSDAFSIG